VREPKPKPRVPVKEARVLGPWRASGAFSASFYCILCIMTLGVRAC
jgi:hypothetical protein